MKPAAFDYFRPDTIEEAVGLLSRYDGEAKVLAGGQSLVPLMNFRLAQPTCLIDVSRIDDLCYISESNGSLAIGSMVRQSAVEDSDLVRRKCPLLAEATEWIGHKTTRNRGTIGGSLVHADPSAEYPAVAVALDGELKVRGPEGERVIQAQDFFITVCTTALAPDEIVTEVRLPVMQTGSGWAFVELNRRHGDYAIVGAAAALSLDGHGLCSDVRIALVGVGETPVRCQAAEAALKRNTPTRESIKEVSDLCAASVEPRDDLHASAAYKRAMVGVFVETALRTALSRVQER